MLNQSIVDSGKLRSRFTGNPMNLPEDQPAKAKTEPVKEDEPTAAAARRMNRKNCSVKEENARHYPSNAISIPAALDVQRA